MSDVQTATKATITPALITFAFVRERLEQTGDIVTGLTPLFAPVIKERAGQIFDANLFASDLKRVYGISVSTLAVKDIEPRLAKSGLLEASKVGGGSPRYYNAALDIPSNTQIEARVSTLVENLVSQIHQRLERKKIIATHERIEELLFARLSKLDFVHSDDVGGLDATTETLPEGQPPNKVDAAISTTLAKIITEIRETDQNSFKLLTDIAGGALVSEVIATVRVPPKTGAFAKGLQVFFDTPLLIDFLDFSDPARHADISQLVNDIKKVQASIAVFDHSVDEFHYIISKAKDVTSARDAETPVALRVAMDRDARLRVMQALADPREYLRDKKISIVDFDQRLKDYYKFFSKEEEQELFHDILPGSELRIRIADTKSAAHTFRIIASSGRSEANIFRSKAVFVTQNTRLIRQANNYFRKSERIVDYQAPPLVSDRHMAGLLWLAVGGAGDEVPKRKLIAACAAAMMPHRDLLKRMYDLLASVDQKSADKYEAIINDRRCLHYLVSETLGSPQALTADTALEKLEEMKAELAREIEERKNLEKSEALEKLQMEIENKHQKEIDALRQNFEEDIRGAEKRSSLLEDQLRQVNDELRQRTVGNEHLEQQIKELASQSAKLQEQAKSIERAAILSALRSAQRAGIILIGAIYLSLVIVLAMTVAITNAYLGDITIGGTKIGPLVTGALVLLATTAIGMLQFYHVPGFIFGNFVEACHRKVFEKKCRSLGVNGNDAIYRIDWEKCKLLQE